MRRFFTILALSFLPLTGCAYGDNSPYEGYEPSDSLPYVGSLATPELDDHGISIPLPPPSLTDDPEQDVYVKGEVAGADGRLQGSVVHAVDLVGGDEVECTLDPGRSEFRCHGLVIDVTDNCVELWVVDSDGREGPHVKYQAVINTSGQGIETVEGCE